MKQPIARLSEGQTDSTLLAAVETAGAGTVGTTASTMTEPSAPLYPKLLPETQPAQHFRLQKIGELEAFLRRDPAEPQDAATKNYVDSRKPLITVWAERKGTLGTGRYEWSFGAGANLPMHGYTMMAAGRVLRMGLTATRSTAPPSTTATVVIVVNETTQTSYGVTSDQYSGTKTFGTPLELAQGDRVNFRSATTNEDVLTAVVSVLIELDL